MGSCWRTLAYKSIILLPGKKKKHALMQQFASSPAALFSVTKDQGSAHGVKWSLQWGDVCPCNLGWWKPGLQTSNTTLYPINHTTFPLAPSQLISPIPVTALPDRLSFVLSYSSTFRTTISVQQSKVRMKPWAVGSCFLAAYFCCQGERRWSYELWKLAGSPWGHSLLASRDDVL